MESGNRSVIACTPKGGLLGIQLWGYFTPARHMSLAVPRSGYPFTAVDNR